MPDNPREKREKDLKKTEDNRKRYHDAVRRMRDQLDRTHLSSSSRKPLEKAFKKLTRQGLPDLDALSEDDDE